MLARSPYSGTSIQQLGESLRAGEITCLSLMEQTLEFIETQDEHIHAFVSLDKERALAQATQADTDLQSACNKGKLHGIPFAVKDIIDCAGFATDCGASLPLRQAPDDATCVRILKQAGAIMIGKLNTYEFALNGPDFNSKFTPSRNPWNCHHITGGSSSGSAAAVAGGMVAFALGTDTGGSVRSPAAYCGCVGLKPTFGKFSAEGIIPLAPSMDVVGWLTRNVADNALIFDILQGLSSQQLIQQDMGGLTIGYARAHFADDPQCDNQIITALDEAASQLSLMGACVREVALPNYSAVEVCGANILRHEALQFHEPKLQQNPEIYHDFTRNYLLQEIQKAKSDDVAQVHQTRQHIRQHIDELLQNHDAILLANTLTPAPPLADFADSPPRWTPMRTITFNITGHPALALPAGFTRQGLPIGLQLVAKHHDEAMLYRIALQLERYSGWTDNQPPQNLSHI